MIERDLADSDYYSIIPRRESIEDMGEDWLSKYKKQYDSCEYKKTIADEHGNIIFIFGVAKTGWTWIIASDLIEKYALESMAMMESLSIEVLDLFPSIQRVYTFNNPKWESAIKWLKRWGFKEHSRHLFSDGIERILLVKERY